jgi:hypothetical protein
VLPQAARSWKRTVHPCGLLLSAALLGLSCGPAGAGERAQHIADLLTRTPGWTVFIEWTPALQPGERADRAGYQFFRRGDEVVGRTTALAEGFNCEFKVRVTDRGVELHARSRACNERYGDDAPYTVFDFDPEDRLYPFKRLNVPQKWWLSPHH